MPRCRGRDPACGRVVRSSRAISGRTGERAASSAPERTSRPRASSRAAPPSSAGLRLQTGRQSPPAPRRGRPAPATAARSPYPARTRRLPAVARHPPAPPAPRTSRTPAAATAATSAGGGSASAAPLESAVAPLAAARMATAATRSRGAASRARAGRGGRREQVAHAEGARRGGSPARGS